MCKSLMSNSPCFLPSQIDRFSNVRDLKFIRALPWCCHGICFHNFILWLPLIAFSYQHTHYQLPLTASQIHSFVILTFTKRHDLNSGRFGTAISRSFRFAVTLFVPPPQRPDLANFSIDIESQDASTPCQLQLDAGNHLSLLHHRPFDGQPFCQTQLLTCSRWAKQSYNRIHSYDTLPWYKLRN